MIYTYLRFWENSSTESSNGQMMNADDNVHVAKPTNAAGTGTNSLKQNLLHVC